MILNILVWLLGFQLKMCDEDSDSPLLSSEMYMTKEITYQYKILKTSNVRD